MFPYGICTALYIFKYRSILNIVLKIYIFKYKHLDP